MSLQEKVLNYQPSRATIQLVQRAKIVLLVGISGAGKDTIKHKLLETGDFKDIVSHTTRQPRVNNGRAEVDGQDYHFIDDTTAENMLDEQVFIEAKFVHGTIYGTSSSELEQAYQSSKIAITDIDVQGVDEYKQISREVVAIFILPPSFEVWQERLKKRYASQADFDAEWKKRHESAIKELRRALEVPYYHFIINDDLDAAVMSAGKIAHKPDIFTRKDDEARLAARDLLASIENHV